MASDSDLLGGLATRPATPADRDGLVAMRSALWPESPANEHAAAVDAFLAGSPLSSTPLVMIVACQAGAKNNALLGFIEVDIRSHVDGCDPTRPSGYVEGWYVVPEARGTGVGGALMVAAESWCRGQGCLEIGSDALADNTGSIAAHQALGFEIVDRCINFRKDLR